MTSERYHQLNNGPADYDLTEEEIKQGWHFCHEFDGLCRNSNEEEFKCNCNEHQKNNATGIEALVCADIAARQSKGIAKYGTTVEDNPLPLKEWLQHAYEECLDQAVYLKKCINCLDKI